MSVRTRHILVSLSISVVTLLGMPRPADAQLGALVSPGRLAKAHAALEGAANCQKCHDAGKGVSASKCLSCHRPIAERIAMKKGVHREVTTDCVSCHVEHAGVDAELRPFEARGFNHAADAGLALDGAHGKVACARCHKTRSFLSASPACSTCHADVHKGQLGPQCARCHTTSLPFKDTRTHFDHAATKFALTGAHQKTPCASCHPNGQYRRGTGTAAACTSCHKTPHKTTLGNTCTTCHTSDSWKTQKVDHARTGYVLKGAHARLACASCHKQPATRVVLKAERCADCHTDPHRGKFKQDCASCHSEKGFAGAPFDHAMQARFALDGAHAKVACAACHTRAPGVAPAVRRPGLPAPAASTTAAAKRDLGFSGLTAECASCHQDVHRGQAGAACLTCHTTATFRGVRYVHKGAGAFFAGNHQTVACARCHTIKPGTEGGQPGVRLGSNQSLTGLRPAPGSTTSAWKDTAAACASCHRDVHMGQLGNTCERCHAVDAAKFAATRFSHGAATFHLEGRHAGVACAKCHAAETAAFPGGTGTAVKYKGVAQECRACHKDEHLGQLGKKCEICHTPAGFAIKSYTHLLKRDVLDGKHAGLACTACHTRVQATFPDGTGTGVRYTGLGSCATCHADVHKGGMGADCESCHTKDSFRIASRAFHMTGAFPLTGRHLDAPCASCHVRGQIKGTPVTCYDCHWQRRQDDRYKLRLGMQCDTCHRTTSWTATTWSHVAQTGVALNAQHRVLGCDSCHQQLEFRPGIAVDCISCHRGDYDRTAQPNHRAAGFPVACEACHKPADIDWHTARFDHGATFPLVGAHALQECAVCHKGSTYKGTPRLCIGCHETDYKTAQQPNHQTAGFPTDCQSCHRESDPDWHRATFNHDTAFRLEGTHRTAPCVACHTTAYRGTPRDCVACHKADYDGTKNPAHATAGFSTDCQTCHRASDPDWHGASFNHDTFFALQGTHRTLACASCHKTGAYKGTPRDCYGCHRTNYDRTSNPNHVAAGFPTTCDACHRGTDASWNQARFTHTFPITSGAHKGIACNVCHVTAGNYRVFSCIVCHDRSRTDSKHGGVSGYRYDSPACYACHPTGRH